MLCQIKIVYYYFVIIFSYFDSLDMIRVILTYNSRWRSETKMAAAAPLKNSAAVTFGKKTSFSILKLHIYQLLIGIIKKYRKTRF